jgi:hypothetical protein
VHHDSFRKLKRILTLMIRRAKGLESILFFITDLKTFGSNVFLTLKIMEIKMWP